MIHIHNNDWRTWALKNAGSIIIPMAGRYHYFKDRNISVNERWERIPNNLIWLLHHYLGKFTQEECVNAVADFNYLSGTFGLDKNVTSALTSSICQASIKPEPQFLHSFVNKPSIISLNVASSAFDFDNKANTYPNNELICEDDKTIKAAIAKALTSAIKSLPKDKDDIFILPLFRNAIYRPNNPNKININWDVDRYINSMVLFLSEYNLDRYNIHLFIRTNPAKPKLCS